jgi:hypothetical protein
VLRYVVFSEAGQSRTVEGQAVTVKTEVLSCPPVTAAPPALVEAAPDAPMAFPVVETGTAEETETPAPHATPDLSSTALDSNRAKVTPGSA